MTKINKVMFSVGGALEVQDCLGSKHNVKLSWCFTQSSVFVNWLDIEIHSTLFKDMSCTTWMSKVKLISMFNLTLISG